MKHVESDKRTPRPFACDCESSIGTLSTALKLPSDTTDFSPSAETGIRCRMRLKAYAVHLFTAAGASLAMLALLEAAQQDWAMMAIWLAVAFVVDGIDGPLARRYGVHTNAPVIDGALLDLIIDFLTYVMIPAYALYGSGLLPGWTGWFVVLLIPFASSLYFADTRMKTDDASFRGFPACWNMVVLALLVIQPGWVVILGLVLLLSAAQFLMLRFIHPVRTSRWRAVSLPVAVIWTGCIAYSAWFDFASMSVLTVIVGVTSAYLLLAGIAQQVIYKSRNAALM